MTLLVPLLLYPMLGRMQLENGQYHPVRGSATRTVILTRCVPPEIRPGDLSKIRGEISVNGLAQRSGADTMCLR